MEEVVVMVMKEGEVVEVVGGGGVEPGGRWMRPLRRRARWWMVSPGLRSVRLIKAVVAGAVCFVRAILGNRCCGE